METLKVKSMLLALLALLTVSIMTSCQQDAIEDLHPTVENTTADIDERNFANLITPFNSLTPQIFKKWWNSYEEETLGNVEFYRPDGYNFPPSRGRTGFEFLPNGDFFYYYPGPTDAPMVANGTWKQMGDSRIIVKLPDPNNNLVRLYFIDFVFTTNNILVIRPINIQV